MKCILHIGTPKTGTTSLQEFLHRNRELLARNGFLYTTSAGVRNNQSLAVAAFNADRRDDFTRRHGLHDDKELRRHQDTTVNALRTELKKAKSQHTVIFSSEHIQLRLRTDQEVARLKSILNGLGLEQVSVLVYLRAPAELARSLYSTAVKAGATRAAPPGPDYPDWHHVCDHRATLMRFRKVFGVDAVVPRIYSKADLVNGSIIDDFAEAIALPLSKIGGVIPKQQNESVTAFGLEILRRINDQIPVFGPDDRLNPLRGNIVSYVLEHCKDGERYVLPVEVRRQYEQAFREGNEWVRSEYFPDRQELFEDTATPCLSEPGCNQNELDQIAELICAIWIDKSRHANRKISEILKVPGRYLKKRRR